MTDRKIRPTRTAAFAAAGEEEVAVAEMDIVWDSEW